MKFWQAVVTAQLAAGSVYADRHAPGVVHFVWEASALAFGALAWWLGAKFFGSVDQGDKR